MKVKKSVLLKAFKAANPKLVEMSPEIEIDFITEMSRTSNGKTEDHKYDPPLVQITVKHPFVFDNRLIPENFQGFEVDNVTIGKFSKEFPDPGHNYQPIEEYYAPERYIAFVSRKINLIRKTLKNPGLSEADALDALTGGFEKHIKWCEELSQGRK